MQLYILLVLYAVGFFIYLYKRNSILYYYLCWSIFAPYVTSFLILDKDIVNVVNGQSNYFLLLIYVINSVRFKSFIVDRKSTTLLCLIFFFLLLASFFNGAHISFYLKWAVSNILPIYFLVAIQKTISISRRGLMVFCGVNLTIQLIVGFCQYFTSILFVSPLFTMTDYGIIEWGKFMGTFPGENTTASYNCLFYLLLVFLIEWRRGRNIFAVLLLTVVFVYAILLSGIRTYLVLIIIFLPFIIFLKSKNKAFALSIISGGLFLCSTYLIISDYSSNVSTENPIERQINGISELKNGDTETSTLGLSGYILSNYFNPLHIFGEGKLCTRRGYEIIYSREFGDPPADVTDATMAVYLVEFGLLLLVLFLVYYYQLSFRRYTILNRQEKLYAPIVFVLFCIAAITDSGIFSSNTLLLISMMSMVLASDVKTGTQAVCPAKRRKVVGVSL